MTNLKAVAHLGIVGGGWTELGNHGRFQVESLDFAYDWDVTHGRLAGKPAPPYLAKPFN
jgi:hypothetical protein